MEAAATTNRWRINIKSRHLVKAAATANRWRNIISSRQLVEAAATANRLVEELHKEQEKCYVIKMDNRPACSCSYPSIISSSAASLSALVRSLPTCPV